MVSFWGDDGKCGIGLWRTMTQLGRDARGRSKPHRSDLRRRVQKGPKKSRENRIAIIEFACRVRANQNAQKLEIGGALRGRGTGDDV